MWWLELGEGGHDQWEEGTQAGQWGSQCPGQRRNVPRHNKGPYQPQYLVIMKCGNNCGKYIVFQWQNELLMLWQIPLQFWSGNKTGRYTSYLTLDKKIYRNIVFSVDWRLLLSHWKKERTFKSLNANNNSHSAVVVYQISYSWKSVRKNQDIFPNGITYLVS